MPEPSTLALFVAAALLLLITPGPAVLYIITRSVDQGRMAGIVSALGCGIGTLFHVTAAALGLSALLAGTIGGWIKSNARYLRAERYFAGTVYIGLGLTTALSSSNKSK